MPEDQPPNSLPPTQSASLEAGQRVFRHYVLHRFLGRGALGAAWLVVHEGHGRELAMRFAPEAWLRDERVMAALRDAVVKLLDVTHPHIVGVLDFVRDQQAAAIVSRFVEGTTLHDVRAAAPNRFLSVETLQPWLAQLCDALDFAWQRHDAVHGDISPQNLLITPNNELRLLDFGLARSLYDVPGPTGSPLITGTQAYLSPERARSATLTMADDVYGFGATVYEMLTSRPVFFRGNLLWQLESVVPPSMSERRGEFGITGDPIPPEWEGVIAACLAKNREDRPRDFREVGERLGLLSSWAGASEMPSPVVLPRVQDTSTTPRLEPSRPISLSDEFSSSEMTAPMEMATIAGIDSAADATLVAEEGEQGRQFNENAQISVYRPNAAPVGLWIPAIVFAHITGHPPQPPPGVPEGLEELPPASSAPLEKSDDSVVVVLEGAGLEIHPAEQRFRWMESIHKLEFRFRAAGPSAGTTVAGKLTARWKGQTIAELEIPVRCEPRESMRPGPYELVGNKKVTITRPPEPPPAPAAEPKPIVRVNPSIATTYPAPAPAPDDAELTMAGIPKPAAPAPVPPPMPMPAPVAASAPAPVAAPKPQAAPPAPAAPVAPPPTAPTPALEKRRPAGPPPLPVAAAPAPPAASPPPLTARAATPPLPPASAPPPSPPPAPPSSSGRSLPLLWIIGGLSAFLLLVGGGAAFYFLRLTPTITQVEPTPDPVLPEITPTPVKPTPIPPRTATPSPTPVAPRVRELTVSDAAALAASGPIREAVYLTGSFRVSSSFDRVATARPSDPSQASKVRVTATYLAGSRLPADGTTVAWTGADQMLVRELRRGGDGQLNITVEQQRR